MSEGACLRGLGATVCSPCQHCSCRYENLNMTAPSHLFQSILLYPTILSELSFSNVLPNPFPSLPALSSSINHTPSPAYPSHSLFRQSFGLISLVLYPVLSPTLSLYHRSSFIYSHSLPHTHPSPATHTHTYVWELQSLWQHKESDVYTFTAVVTLTNGRPG